MTQCRYLAHLRIIKTILIKAMLSNPLFHLVSSRAVSEGVAYRSCFLFTDWLVGSAARDRDREWGLRIITVG